MNIALIAHDSKKELMVQFCIAYCRILSQHTLVATGTTGKLVSDATGLKVQRFLSGTHGGDQQIAARIACDEIDLLLFFRDPISAKPHEPNEMNLLRLCDVHNIPMATNIATAEVLVWSAATWIGATSSILTCNRSPANFGVAQPPGFVVPIHRILHLCSRCFSTGVFCAPVTILP